MLVVCCDICGKKLLTNPNGNNFQLCERCTPFAEEYYKELAKLVGENQTAFAKTYEKFRNGFLQQKTKKPAELKAV